MNIKQSMVLLQIPGPMWALRNSLWFIPQASPSDMRLVRVQHVFVTEKNMSLQGTQWRFKMMYIYISIYIYIYTIYIYYSNCMKQITMTKHPKDSWNLVDVP
jgi:hypothetical protein